MLGDFNYLDIDWTNPDLSCPYHIPLISLSYCLFLNQQVLEATRKSNIFNIIFSPADFINCLVGSYECLHSLSPSRCSEFLYYLWSVYACTETP